MNVHFLVLNVIKVLLPKKTLTFI
ncbi:unnamed protein product [Larinioides sclopetarius]|uniref:NADH dehydrogenase subunit 1 n=1 Tax=Larinioides sclopetarius TaxID=280406 RepID=A0AAV1ZYR9_9ARAC